jgi:hypothetical protein
MRSHCCLCVARKRLGKNPPCRFKERARYDNNSPNIAGQRLGSVKILLSLLGNGSVKIPLSLLGNGSVIISLLLLGNGSVETLTR